MITNLLDEAEQLASAGKLTDAEVMFARAVEGSSDSAAFRRFGDFLCDTGRLSQAEAMYQRALTAAGSPAAEADALRSLGILYLRRGEVERSLGQISRARTIDESLGRTVSVADDYRSLGNIHLDRGEIDRAEELYRRAADLSREAGDQNR